MKCFSMFSGIGGFDLALQNLGHEIVGACEIDSYAREIYSRHFPDVHIHNDATTLQAESLPSVDLLCGGFPCQAFSVAGKRLGFDDSRGTLFFEIARIAKEKRPRYLFLENVRGLLFHDKGQTMRTIIGILDELGYDAEWQVINSKNFVPQNRERVFIVGHLRGERTRQVFPLGDCGEINVGEIKKMMSYSQCGSVYHDSGISPTINAGSHGYSIGCIQLSKIKYHRMSENQQYRVYDTDGISPALWVGHAMNSPSIKQDRIRRLTPTECERLQGFPDGWTEGISDTQRYKCLGNAVSVPVVEYIASNFTIGEGS